MKITKLDISNFKAIKNISLSDLGDLVVIAGPNGSGKSCIFDAIRLIKSIYGGYQPNEIDQWFGEFQININNHQPEMLSLFRDKNTQIRIHIEISLSKKEKEFISSQLFNLLKPLVWQRISPDTMNINFRSIPIESRLREFEPKIDEITNSEVEEIYKIINSDFHEGEVIISPELFVKPNHSPVLSLVFSVFDPQNIGIIDFHGAQRNYQREQIGGINVNIETSESQLRNNALYNYASKYTNIKSEMAGVLVRELLSKASGQKIKTRTSITETLKELFDTFFPGKSFLGPLPVHDGSITFPVRTVDGAVHDINDLSSGEKEILYGYLKIHNVAPRDSVILIDEPELHLNPRLIKGLPQFYYKHLGKELNNQMWMTTHSDTLLREAVKDSSNSVFHIQLPNNITGIDNQVERVKRDREIDNAIIDLIGDLATFTPNGKIVIFEGGGESEFDIEMVNTLFPDFQLKVNLISGGNKVRVRAFHEALEKAQTEGIIKEKIYSIVDKDFDEREHLEGQQNFCWDVYHIENYLLVPKYILQTLKGLLGKKCGIHNEEEVTNALKTCASECMSSLIFEQLDQWANLNLTKCIKTRIRNNSANPTTDLSNLVIKSISDQNDLSQTILSKVELIKKFNQINNKMNNDLSDGKWKTSFRGRDILKCFIGHWGNGLKYEYFINSLIDKMRIDGYKPEGMNEILNKIITD
jgi:predicted ATPase